MIRSMRTRKAAAVRTTVVVGVVGAALLSSLSCVDPPGARELITTIFNADVVCFPTFLAQAEPVFLDAQARAQIEIGVSTFNRDLNNTNVTFDRASYDACLHAAQNNDCDELSNPAGACATVFKGKL